MAGNTVAKVAEAVSSGAKHINDIVEQTGLLRPTVRRILGQGAKKGTFTRLRPGVYALRDDAGRVRVYIENGKAQDVLPQLASLGLQLDMAFLDIPYFSEAIIGRNRCKSPYQYMTPDEFYRVASAIKEMMAHPSSHVYLMLSGARTAQTDMERYIEAMCSTGMQFIGEGGYKKYFGNGRPVTNVRGEEAKAERLLLFTRSGDYHLGEVSELCLDFHAIRPTPRSSYPTQKSTEFVDKLILQSTFRGNVVADPCAGSGVVGESALHLGRSAVLIESSEATVENYINPLVQDTLFGSL